MKVVLSERTIGDLIRIGRYIGEDNPARATTFVAELERRCETLADSPRGFPLLPGWGRAASAAARTGIT